MKLVQIVAFSVVVTSGMSLFAASTAQALPRIDCLEIVYEIGFWRGMRTQAGIDHNMEAWAQANHMVEVLSFSYTAGNC